MSGIQKRAAALVVLIAVVASFGAVPWIASAEGAEFRSLFNGHDLAGWLAVGAGAGEDWLVRDGCLLCQGKHHSWLRSSRQYGDFRLVLEYQVAKGANSGVYVHVPADGNHHRDRSSLPPAGFEIQILDDHASRYAGLKDYQYSASLYDIAGASPRVSKPAGEWNKLEIECVGLHVSVIHNGVRVVDTRPERFPLLALRNKQGYLGLQSHNGVVRFRNLQIECLENNAAGGSPAPSR
jgi:Domain of Unknown Function (DUF1080)